MIWRICLSPPKLSKALLQYIFWVPQNWEDLILWRKIDSNKLLVYPSFYLSFILHFFKSASPLWTPKQALSYQWPCCLVYCFVLTLLVGKKLPNFHPFLGNVKRNYKDDVLYLFFDKIFRNAWYNTNAIHRLNEMILWTKPIDVIIFVKNKKPNFISVLAPFNFLLSE